MAGKVRRRAQKGAKVGSEGRLHVYDRQGTPASIATVAAAVAAAAARGDGHGVAARDRKSVV